MLIKKQILILLFPFLSVSNALANNEMPTYASDGLSLIKVTTEYFSSKSRPLQEISSITFPNYIKYIGQAINYTLLKSGYRLESRLRFDKESRTLFMQQLPFTQKEYIYSTTEQLIQKLIGQNFTIQANDVQRTISIKYNTNTAAIGEVQHG